MRVFYYILLGIILLGCQQHRDEVGVREKAFVKDSLRILKLFKTGKVYPPSKIMSYENTLWYGNLFNNNYNYLIINKDREKEKTYYTYNNNTLNEIFHYSVSGGGRFISDTVYDVNQDSFLDVLVKRRYRATTISDFYLQNAEGAFNDPVKTFNSVQKGKLLLGHVNTNAPIEKYYKFKWNGFALDTIEWIAYDNSKESGKYYMSKKMAVFEVNKAKEYVIGLDKSEYKVLDELPSEYRVLDSLYDN